MKLPAIIAELLLSDVWEMLPVTSTVPFSCAVLSFAVNFTVAASFAPSMSVPIPASTFSAARSARSTFPSPFTSAA